MKWTIATFGVIATVVYVIAIVLFRWADFPTLRTIPLNELGDFLAGVFGPLMLFWLILGFIQQQRELRQNTEALQLQATELKNSVEQHKQLVIATREQVSADLKSLELEQQRSIREAQPRFFLVRAGLRMVSSGRKTFIFNIQNTGQPASEVNISTVPSLAKGRFSFVDRGESVDVKWSGKEGESPCSPLILEVACVDNDSRPFVQNFDLSLEEDGKNYRQLTPG